MKARALTCPVVPPVASMLRRGRRLPVLAVVAPLVVFAPLGSRPLAAQRSSAPVVAPPSASDVPFTVAAEGATLSGTLRLPAGVAKPAVVVLVAGSGPTDRDGNNPMGLKPNTLRQLAESLGAAGIASYRFDKRGVAASMAPGLQESALRFETYADDIVAIVRALASDGRTGRAVIVGHSEGALLGLLAAPQAGVAGYVSIAGVARPPQEVLHEQLAAQLPPPLLAQADSVLAQLAAGRQPVASPKGLEMLFRPSVQPYLVSWFRHSGEAAIRRWSGPCLILQGTHDVQVPAAEAERLKAAQPRCELTVLPGMNHVLKTTPADRAAQAASYADPALPLTAGLAARLVTFVRAVTAR